MISINTLQDLWAKSPVAGQISGESLLNHTMSVVEVAQQLSAFLPFPLPVRVEIVRELVLCAALHDTGKAALGFQMSLRHKPWGKRHEMLSLAIASAVAPQLTVPALFAIATHHKTIDYFEDVFNSQQLPSTSSPTWQEMVKELLTYKTLLIEALNLLASKLQVPLATNTLEPLPNQTQLKKAWWSQKYQSDKIDFAQRRYASLLRGLLITSDHLASAHQFAIPAIPVQKEYQAIIKQNELKGRGILPFQQRCAETKEDAILKAPTGSGKTAGIFLWAAHNQAENGRLFYVLPHTASINAMHQRLQKIYGNAVGVLHHKNAAYLFRLFENDGCSNPAEKAKELADLARELYHPIRVTTPHQILRVALQGKGWELGLAEFPNACFVFDEIHAFEPLLVGLTIATIKWLKKMGAKVFFASATLPSFLEQILKTELHISENNVVVPDATLGQDRQVLDKIRHQIKIKPGSLLSNLPQVIEEIRNSGQSALIICNHVHTSQQIFQKMREEFADTVLLHSRFNSRDRMGIETRIQDIGRRPRILVATQAVEVSLDLDYDCGYIEPAPADALGQRLGRINRKGSRPTPAPVVIFSEPSAQSRDKPMYLPYDQKTTESSIDLLRACDLLSEQQLTDIVNQIYGQGYEGDAKIDYERGLNNNTINQFDERMTAGMYRPWVESVIEGTDGQIEVLPMDLYEEFTELKRQKRHLEASQLLVPIQARQYWKLKKDGVLFFDKDMEEWKTILEYTSTMGLDFAKQIDNLF